MKKVIILSGALFLLSSLPANAQIIIQPTIIETPPPVYAVVPPPAYVAAPVPVYPAYVVQPASYPVYVDHHRTYSWQYWHDHREHREHREHRDHDEHERRDHDYR